ncbi:MAG: HEAT repeat domain-containing protein [Bradymonadaceae bacterium]
MIQSEDRRRFIPALTELLSATNAKLRFNALYFLDQVAYDAGDAKEALVALCSDDDVVTRRHAMSALIKVGHLSDEELKAVTANLVDRQRRFDALMALANSFELPLWVLDELRQVFEGTQKSSDFEQAVKIAARFKGAEESILELLHDERLNVRLAAICVLRQQDYSDAARASLESLLQDAEPRLRAYATLALVKVAPDIARETREDLASRAEQAVQILVAIGAPAGAVLPRLREAAKRLSHLPAVAEAVSTLESCLDKTAMN